MRTVITCKECSLLLPSQISNPSVTISDTPCSIGVDLFSHQGATFLVCINHWSDYPMYEQLSSASMSTVVKCLTSWFGLLGWPKSICSDRGQQFNNIFDIIYTEKNSWTICTLQSKSNSLAESAVKIVKNILHKCTLAREDPDKLLYGFLFPSLPDIVVNFGELWFFLIQYKIII